ncbi:MAG TPA: M67 family peptidase [Cycloclasticus sp.]|jgi:proteasome lid subunit RPN8/RPN11|nr:M67 family peptidase [Cycloclasticus sp.]HIL92769.1 M67 family peptidase [Cycloclasticus sp.]
MHPKEVELPRKLVNELLHKAQLSPQHEVCGFVGIKDQTFSCYSVENIAEDRATQFLMEPTQQLAAIKNMREQEEEIFAIYHSHPTAPAIPSARDIEHSTYPDAFYLIISLNTKGVLEMRCFKLLHDENIVEITLRMAEN